MDGMEFGKAVLLLGVLLVAISGIIAFALWTRSPRYGETTAAFNVRLRWQYRRKFLQIGGATLALGGIILMLTAVLQREPRLYQLGIDPRIGAADVVTPAEEGDRRLNELAANVRILSDSQRKVMAALAKPKSPLANKLAACRRTVRRLVRQSAVQPDFTIPMPPPRSARIALDQGLSRGDSGEND